MEKKKTLVATYIVIRRIFFETIDRNGKSVTTYYYIIPGIAFVLTARVNER